MKELECVFLYCLVSLSCLEKNSFPKLQFALPNAVLLGAGLLFKGITNFLLSLVAYFFLKNIWAELEKFWHSSKD